MTLDTLRQLHASRRAQTAPASPIRKLTPYADAAKARGITVYHLNIGQPDFATPVSIFDTIHQFKEPVLSYAPSPGLKEAREAWASYYAAHGMAVSPDEVLITIGGSEAIQFAIGAVADPGENILVFEPTYTNYCGFAAATSVLLKGVPLDAGNGYALPPIDHIEDAVDDRTRAILLCNPNNPTGSAYSADTILQFVALAERKNIFLIVDEVYREFVYDGLPETSVLHVAGHSQHVIMVDSVSKRFNACGARIGCLVTPNAEVYQGALRMAQARLSAPSIDQLAMVPLLRDPLGYTTQLVHDYQRRRDAVLVQLRATPEVRYSEPQGAFYTVVSLPIDDSETFARWLLESFSSEGETVFVAPMPGFYVTEGCGKQEIRLAFVLEEERLGRATALLQQGVIEYRKVMSGRGKTDGG